MLCCMLFVLNIELWYVLLSSLFYVVMHYSVCRVTMVYCCISLNVYMHHYVYYLVSPARLLGRSGDDHVGRESSLSCVQMVCELL